MRDLTMLQEALLPKAVGLVLGQFTETNGLVVVDAHSSVGELACPDWDGILDVEQSTVIDVPPDRTSETLAARLTAHPGAETACGEYSRAVRAAAPDVIFECRTPWLRAVVLSAIVSTDIHGGIEFRHPGVGTDYYEGEPWVGAMDLWPLYDETDYASFGCLFGVRNYAGYPPLAAGRGLPDDLSSGLRECLQPWVADDHLAGTSWVSWAEIEGLDPATTPEHYIGRLTWSSRAKPSILHQQLVPAEWPPELVAAVGPRPQELDGGDHYVEWNSGDLLYRYESLTAGSILGPRSHWPHVFAVMKALAERFGDDAVRLVVAFD